MNSLKTISDSLLLGNTLRAAGDEKAATLHLLDHLAEVDRRSFYAARGYSGLWEYVHKVLGYSEAQASDRVNAMRVRVPEVKESLASRELTLTSAAKLGTHMRRERLSAGDTLLVLEEIKGKPSRTRAPAYKTAPLHPRYATTHSKYLSILSRYISVHVKNTIRIRSEDRCEGRPGLQFDHIKPFARGGSNEV